MTVFLEEYVDTDLFVLKKMGPVVLGLRDWQTWKNTKVKYSSVADLQHFGADPDSSFQFNEDSDPNTHYFPDLNPLMLQNDPLRLPLFHFDADSGSSFLLWCGSGSGSSFTKWCRPGSATGQV